MLLIPVVLLNVLCASILFYLGSALGKNVSSRAIGAGLLLAGIMLAAPGLLFVLYYTHLV